MAQCVCQEDEDGISWYLVATRIDGFHWTDWSHWENGFDWQNGLHWNNGHLGTKHQRAACRLPHNTAYTGAASIDIVSLSWVDDAAIVVPTVTYWAGRVH